jgi:hypothetical protein
MFPVYPTTAYVERLTALNASFYPTDSPDEKTVARLFTNDITPDLNSSVVSFTEADFATYVQKPVEMSPVSLNDQGLVTSRSGLLNWSTLAGAATQTIYGVFIVSLLTGKLVAAQRFEQPQQVGGPLPQSVSGVWRTSEPLTTYGWIDVES